MQKYVGITEHGVYSNGEEIYSLNALSSIDEKLRFVYKNENLKYSKFYKMDQLSRLAYLSSELLFKGLRLSDETYDEMSLFITNSTASLDTDIAHQKSISTKENYLPSPSIFVYTLANIMIGEIAIRHKIKGENYCLIFNKFDAKFMAEYSDILFDYYGTNHLMIGWVDVLKNDYKSFLAFISRDMDSNWAFNSENLNKAYINELR